MKTDAPNPIYERPLSVLDAKIDVNFFPPAPRSNRMASFYGMTRSVADPGTTNGPETDRRCGFSLAEVVIAMGLAVIALIGIFGLLQSGLLAYRQSMNSTIVSSIGQRILAQYLLADFDKVVILAPKTNYFDERGLDKADSNQAVYKSVGEVVPGPILGVDQRNLAKIRITVTSPTQPDFIKIFTSLIARQGKDGP